jgi:ParB family chromosome partitioning protein
MKPIKIEKIVRHGKNRKGTIMKLGLDDINLGDERFRTSYFFPLDPFVRSLKRVGLVSPPVVCIREGSYVLVTGWKRILACREISLSPLSVLEAEEKPDLEMFLLAFFENLATREFGLAEKAEVVRRLEGFGETAEAVVRSYLPLLDLPADRAVRDLLIKLSRTGDDVKKFIRSKNPPLHVVRPLLELIPEEQAFLVPWLLMLGQNKQRELLEDLEEIEARDGTGLQELLASPGIREALVSSSLPAVQRSERLRAFLREKRFPLYSSWRESFEKARRGLGWPEDIGLAPSPFFEGEDLTVEFSFRSREEFLERLGRLEALASKKDFAGLFVFRASREGK